MTRLDLAPILAALMTFPVIAADRPDEVDAILRRALEDPEFKAGAGSSLGMNPEQVRAYRRLDRDVKQALGNSLPDEASVRIIALGRGEVPALRLRLGFATTVRLTDVNGKPLTIKGHSPPGNPQAIEVQPVPPQDDDAREPVEALVVVPKIPFLATNIVLFPEGDHRPLVIALEADTAESSGGGVDFEVDCRLTWVGVKSGERPPVLNDAMLAALQGVPGPDFRAVDLHGLPQARLWVNGEGAYLRLPPGARLASPSPRPQAIASEADGSVVYELDREPVSLVVSVDGRTKVLTVGE